MYKTIRSLKPPDRFFTEIFSHIVLITLRSVFVTIFVCNGSHCASYSKCSFLWLLFLLFLLSVLSDELKWDFYLIKKNTFFSNRSSTSEGLCCLLFSLAQNHLIKQYATTKLCIDNNIKYNFCITHLHILKSYFKF